MRRLFAKLVKYMPYKIQYAISFLKTALKVFCRNMGVKQVMKQLHYIKHDSDFWMIRLVVVLGTKCSLRCKECNNLMPYFKPQFDLPSDVIIESLEKIICKCGGVLCCELIGGEPFVSGNLKPVLERVLNNPKIMQVELTTNATLIPKKELIPLLKNEKVKVRISDYGRITEQPKQKMIDFLKTHEIKYEVLDCEKSWISSGGVEKRYRTAEDLKKMYRRCNSNYYCKCLYGNKLFACPRAASLFELGYMKEDDYLLVSEKLTSDELKQYIMKDFSAACDYCDLSVMGGKKVRPAEQVL